MNEMMFIWFFIGASLVSCGVVAVAIVRMYQSARQVLIRKKVVAMRIMHQPAITVLVYCKNEVNAAILTVDAVLKSRYTYFDIVLIDVGSNAEQRKLLRKYVQKLQLKGRQVELLRRQKDTSMHCAFRAGYNKSKKGNIAITLQAGMIVSYDFIKRAVVMQNQRSVWSVPTTNRSDESPLKVDLVALANDALRIFWHKSPRAEIFTARYLLKNDRLDAIKVNRMTLAIISLLFMGFAITFGIMQNDFIFLWYIWLLFNFYLLAMVWLDTTSKMVAKMRITFIAPMAFILLPIASSLQAFSQFAKRK